VKQYYFLKRTGKSKHRDDLVSESDAIEAVMPALLSTKLPMSTTLYDNNLLIEFESRSRYS